MKLKPINKQDKPKREGFFALTTRLNKVAKEQKNTPVGEEDKVKVEGKDYVAMLLSAFFTLFLPAVLIIGGITVAVMALFGVFN